MLPESLIGVYNLENYDKLSEVSRPIKRKLLRTTRLIYYMNDINLLLGHI